MGRQGTLTRIRATRQLQLLFRDLKFPISEVAFGYMRGPYNSSWYAPEESRRNGSSDLKSRKNEKAEL